MKDSNLRIPGPPTGSVHRDGSFCGQCTRWRILYFLTGLTRCRGSRNLLPRRCGGFGLVSRHKLAEHRFPIVPLLLTLSRRFSHEGARLREQRLSHAGARLREQRLSHHQSSPAGHDRPRHHVPALTVTSGGRGVGFDVACLGAPGGFRTSYAGNSTRPSPGCDRLTLRTITLPCILVPTSRRPPQ